MVREDAIRVQSNPIQKLGEFFIRYGLVLVLGWIGAMKFTSYEAEGIKALVETSPLMSWMYRRRASSSCRTARATPAQTRSKS